MSPIYQHQELKSFVHVPKGRKLYVYEDEAGSTLATLTDIADASIDNPIVLGEDAACYGPEGYGGTALFKCSDSQLWIISDHPDDTLRPLYPVDESAMAGLTASVSELNLNDGQTATAAEVNLLDDSVATISFAAAAGGANVCEVTITVKDAAGATIDAVHVFDLYLSDSAVGAGITGTTASGTVQAKAASGAVLTELTAKKHLRVSTLATGVFILEITDSAKTGFYVCAVNPLNGKVFASAQLVAGNYGS